MIPKTIYQIVPYYLPIYYLESLKINNPNYYYQCYSYHDENDMIAFIDMNPIEEFDKTKEIIKKSSFYHIYFKYYLLYVNGGIFLDKNMMLEENLDNLIDNKSFCSIKSSSLVDSINDGFLCVEPKNEVIYFCLKYLHDLSDEEYKNNKNIIQEKLYFFFNKT